MKRQRGRGRKPGGHQPNRTFESTGPDVKVRGSASIVYEKYLQYARDAQSSGDRVLAESYLQHAEHYFRVLKAMQPQQPVQTQYEQRFDQSFDFEAEGEEGDEEYEGDEGGPAQPYAAAPPPQQQQREPREQRRFDGPREPRERREPREPRDPREFRERREPRAPMPVSAEGGDGEEGGAPYPEAHEGDGPGGEGFGRRGRRRRGRYRPEGEEGGPPREAGAVVAPREAREPREHREPRERRPRETDDDRGPKEGFGDQAPSFLISGE